jgi:hypothetical protein
MKKRSPYLGRIAAGCLVVLFGTLYVGARWFSDIADQLIDIYAYCLLAVAGAATVLSLIAIIRRSSRTPLAWISFAICLAWWALDLFSA